MADRIEIRGLRALGVIGVNQEERERRQPFDIDFDVELDLSKAGQSDNLVDTADYGHLTILAERVVATESHLLLERVAQRIADVLLDADDRIDAVRVSIRKLRPPIPVDVDTSAVTITRRR
jgi:7,8-dihydroneopterin aldolase/epimerase/oxygenase